MYDKSDARSTLSSSTAPKVDGPAGGPSFAEYGSGDPQIAEPTGGRTWITRAQNFAVLFTEAMKGEAYSRPEQPDEYVILLHDEQAKLTVSCADEAKTVQGPAVIVVPPGSSTVTAEAECQFTRLLSNRSTDVLDLAANADTYTEPHPHVAPLVAWPAPPDGFAIRVYPIADIPSDPDRFGRILRCSTFMVNFLVPRQGPRDTTKLSPHHHDDFEQVSLATSGSFVHHIRTPWTTRLDDWRDDLHQECGSPSVMVIPPPTVHTTQAVGTGTNQLIDIFCPPRADFSAKSGWVLNADEYPAPTNL